MLLLKGRKRIFKQPTRAWAAYIYFTMHDTFACLSRQSESFISLSKSYTCTFLPMDPLKIRISYSLYR